MLLWGIMATLLEGDLMRHAQRYSVSSSLISAFGLGVSMFTHRDDRRGSWVFSMFGCLLQLVVVGSFWALVFAHG